VHNGDGTPTVRCVTDVNSCVWNMGPGPCTWHILNIPVTYEQCADVQHSRTGINVGNPELQKGPKDTRIANDF